MIIKEGETNVFRRERKRMENSKADINKILQHQQSESTEDKRLSKPEDELEVRKVKFEKQHEDGLIKRPIKEEIKQGTVEKVAVKIPEIEAKSVQSDDELEEGEIRDEDAEKELDQEYDDEGAKSYTSVNWYREVNEDSPGAIQRIRAMKGKPWVDFPDGAKVLVQHLPPEANENGLWNYFSNFGHILFVYLNHGRDKGFVIFNRREAADWVLRKEHLLWGKPVTVSRAPPI